MYSLQKPILENPFHPLDLSPQDLLRIYNRFQQSRQTNKNPKQELSIDTISQLISSLKGIKPSYIQKCITQSFIKPTISWNDFLTLLDQQAQIRQKILDWVLFYDEGSVKKYKLQKYYPFRSKIQKFYDFITFLKLTSIGDEKLCIIEVDHQKLYLIDVTDGNFKEIDRFQKKNSKMNLQLYLNNNSKNNSKVVNISKVFPPFTQNKKSLNSGSTKFQSEKLITQNSFIQGANLRSSQLGNNQDDEAYFKKERKNIHSVFNIFKNLEIQDSIKLANVTASKIYDKSFNAGHATTIRDAFGQIIVQQKQKIKQTISKNIAPFQKARNKLKSLYEQKSRLSYNPYKVKRTLKPTVQGLNNQLNSIVQNQKKVIHQRKQKSYTLQSVTLSFCQQISCMAIAYHNMQILILKVGKDLNRTCFEQQDLIKISLERDHKKNEVIQSVKFFHHTIRDRWFLLVLIRVEYKNEVKGSTGQSYVLGYEIEIDDSKRKSDYSYKFRCNRQQFYTPKKQSFCLSIQKFEANILEVQPRFGIHLVSFTGKYFTFREQYIENMTNPSLSQYWRLNNEQRFKNSNLSLCCMAIGYETNKILFGTNNGNILLYDSFSHQYKMKKISSKPIVNVKILGNQGFALTQDQKMIILNLMKLEQINSFSTINQDKLHQKVINFQLDNKSQEIWAFGSQLKTYDQQTDQDELHKKRQMEKTYTWRLTKLKNQAHPKNGLKQRIESRLTSQKEIKIKNQPQLKSSEMVISSAKYFILLSEILQVIVIEKSTLKVKFTFILNVPYDSKVMKIAISQTQKLLAVLLFNQTIYIYNIYTQELCLQLKPPNAEKFVSITFLDPKNEYMLASGTESGKIALIPYSSIPQKKISYLSYHKNPVNIVEVKNNFLISCCEGGKICFWQLPFNVIKHEFKVPSSSNYISKIIGYNLTRIVYLKSIDDDIFQVNLMNAKINKMKIGSEVLDPQVNNMMKVDPITNELLLVKSESLTVFSKDNETGQWVVKNKINVYDQKSKKNFQDNEYGEIIYIGIIQSERAVLFYSGGGAFPYIYQSHKIGKQITFNE